MPDGFAGRAREGVRESFEVGRAGGGGGGRDSGFF